jgi:hypothetical protein
VSAKHAQQFGAPPHKGECDGRSLGAGGGRTVNPRGGLAGSLRPREWGRIIGLFGCATIAFPCLAVQASLSAAVLLHCLLAGCARSVPVPAAAVLRPIHLFIILPSAIRPRTLSTATSPLLPRPLLLSPCYPHVPRDSAQRPPLPARWLLLPRRPVRAACSTHVAHCRHPHPARPLDECSSHDFVLRPPQVGQCRCSLPWPTMALTDRAVGPDEPCSWHHACQEGSQCAGTDTAREAPSQRWPSAERWQRQVLRLRKRECPPLRLPFSRPLPLANSVCSLVALGTRAPTTNNPFAKRLHNHQLLQFHSPMSILLGALSGPGHQLPCTIATRGPRAAVVVIPSQNQHEPTQWPQYSTFAHWPQLHVQPQLKNTGEACDNAGRPYWAPWHQA